MLQVSHTGVSFIVTYWHTRTPIAIGEILPPCHADGSWILHHYLIQLSHPCPAVPLTSPPRPTLQSRYSRPSSPLPHCTTRRYVPFEMGFATPCRRWEDKVAVVVGDVLGTGGWDGRQGWPLAPRSHERGERRGDRHRTAMRRHRLTHEVSCGQLFSGSADGHDDDDTAHPALFLPTSPDACLHACRANQQQRRHSSCQAGMVMVLVLLLLVRLLLVRRGYDVASHVYSRSSQSFSENERSASVCRAPPTQLGGLLAE